jgi:hypothetical protein
MAREDFRRTKVVEQEGDKTIEVKNLKDIPESMRREFMMRILLIQSFVKARNKMWDNLSKASPSGRVKYI